MKYSNISDLIKHQIRIFNFFDLSKYFAEYKIIKTNITLCGIATTDIKRRNHPKLNIQVDATTNIQIIDIIMVIIFY
jgi:hypothetical protein